MHREKHQRKWKYINPNRIGQKRNKAQRRLWNSFILVMLIHDFSTLDLSTHTHKRARNRMKDARANRVENWIKTHWASDLMCTYKQSARVYWISTDVEGSRWWTKRCWQLIKEEKEANASFWLRAYKRSNKKNRVSWIICVWCYKETRYIIITLWNS